MQLQKKGFTLVELIVTITIVSILSTIAFIKVQPYLSQSRNTVRMDSIGKMISKIDSYIVSENPIMNLTGTGKEVQGASIAGTGSTQSLYKSGIPHYHILSVSRGEFKDPSSKDDYLLGVTSKSGGKYHLAFTFETDAGALARTEGNWSPRISTPIPGEGKVGSAIFKITRPSDINYFYIGDAIIGLGLTSGTFIQDISNDGTSLYLSSTFSLPGSSIALAQNEVGGLIQSIDDPSVPVVSGEQNLPYRIN